MNEEIQVFDVLYDDENWTAADEPETERKCSMEDALVLSINRFGRVNFPYMAEVSGNTQEEIAAALEGSLIFRDPACYDPAVPYSGWVTGPQYARGNIYLLLDKACEMDRETGLFSRNIEFLRTKLPEAPRAEEIVISLGATWVPAEVYISFICDLLDMKDCPPELVYDNYFHKWVLKGNALYSYLRNRETYGTEDMPALKIIDKTMNACSVKIYDRVEDRVTGKRKSILNKQKTAAAQEKQQLIVREFRNWLTEHPDVTKKLRDIYADKFCYCIPEYDGSFLALPGMNPNVSLYKHQRAAVARIVLSSDNILLNHEVGAGKTYALAAGIHERIRMGLSRKAMYVVPNAVLDSTVQAYRDLYPEEPLEVIRPSDFTPVKREAVMDKIARTESGVFIMAFSSFDFIDLSGCFRLERMEREIEDCKAEIMACSDLWRVCSLESRLKSLTEKRDAFSEKYVEKPADCFDILGIDLLVVDECHFYKNIRIEGGMDMVVGMNAKGSSKADRMLDKCDYIRETGGKIVFATGTPLTNSMAELYVLQRYLQPADLELLKVVRFNDWVNTFSTKHTEFEVDPTAASYRFVTRFDSFHNLPELMAVFGNVCDFYTIDRDELDLPAFNGYQNIAVPRSEEQKEYIGEIVERAERIRRKATNRQKDNYLKLTSDGRKCALDIRLVRPEVSEESCRNGKISAAVSVIRRIYGEYPGMTQAVFCDFSTPSARFNVYSEAKRLLISEGIPESEIAFIYDAVSEKAKRELMDRFNAGTVRVLLGSTSKLGTGVNIQQRLVAVHHLDAPWKPADLIQREGRAIRQGNCNSEVLVYRYVTESSFDAYTWQILENKQRFIASFLSGTMDRSRRSERDISETVLNYSEIKALAIGNPLIRERVKLHNELVRTQRAAYRRRQELLRYQTLLSELTGKRDRLRKSLAAITCDIQECRNKKGPASKSAKEEFGRGILEALHKGIGSNADQVLCTYRGLRVVLPAGMKADQPYLLLSGDAQMTYRVEMKDAKAGGCCTRFDNVLLSLPDRRRQIQSKIKGCERMHRDALEQLKLGNPIEEKAERLMSELNTIDAALKEE